MTRDPWLPHSPEASATWLQWNKSPRPATEFQNAGDLMFFFMRPAPLPQSG